MAFDARTAPLVDGCGCAVSYLRLSVTDRCDQCCTYRMAKKMKILTADTGYYAEIVKGVLPDGFNAFVGKTRVRLASDASRIWEWVWLW